MEIVLILNHNSKFDGTELVEHPIYEKLVTDKIVLYTISEFYTHNESKTFTFLVYVYFRIDKTLTAKPNQFHLIYYSLVCIFDSG